MAADVSRAEDCERLVAQHADRFGTLEVLVNSAGVGVGGSLESLQAKHRTAPRSCGYCSG